MLCKIGSVNETDDPDGQMILMVMIFFIRLIGVMENTQIG
jgi:hypothetical protein